MRAFTAFALALPLALFAGCLEDDPVPEPAATPEEACEARGLADLSCSTFCELNPGVCGLTPPTPAPYPMVPVPTPLLPAAPPGVPALDGSQGPMMPAVCVLVPTLEECPQP